MDERFRSITHVLNFWFYPLCILASFDTHYIWRCLQHPANFYVKGLLGSEITIKTRRNKWIGHQLSYQVNISNAIQIILTRFAATVIRLPLPHFILKDTHREQAPSNKTPALIISRTMSIWVNGTSNQLFIRRS